MALQYSAGLRRRRQAASGGLCRVARHPCLRRGFAVAPDRRRAVSSPCIVLAKDDYIKANVMERKKIADILEVFFRAGCNGIMGLIDRPPLKEAIMEAQDRTGVEGIIISTPSFPYNASTPSEGFDRGDTERIVELNQTSRLGHSHAASRDDRRHGRSLSAPATADR